MLGFSIVGVRKLSATGSLGSFDWSLEEDPQIPESNLDGDFGRLMVFGGSIRCLVIVRTIVKLVFTSEVVSRGLSGWYNDRA